MFGKFPAIDISATGLAAERMRMEITANNIANASTTMTESGDPYRRQMVVFEGVMDSVADAKGKHGFRGVEVIGIDGDMSEFPQVYNPGHPHANADGFVRLSNVKVPEEMVDLITASRAYEANTRAIGAFKEMIEQTLTLLRGS